MGGRPPHARRRLAILLRARRNGRYDQIGGLLRDIYFLGPILAILITVYVRHNVVRSLRGTAVLFLQAVPENLDIHEIEGRLRAIPEVRSMHHTHLWSVDGSGTS
jgi:Co/Zn/Cd efflux system component